MAKAKKLLSLEEELINKVEAIASEMGLNFQQYVSVILTKIIKDKENEYKRI